MRLAPQVWQRLEDPKVKSKTRTDQHKLIDSTLEGKDETEIGRVQRKAGPAENVLKK
jgi:hypothetical protein